MRPRASGLLQGRRGLRAPTAAWHAGQDVLGRFQTALPQQQHAAAKLRLDNRQCPPPHRAGQLHRLQVLVIKARVATPDAQYVSLFHPIVESLQG